CSDGVWAHWSLFGGFGGSVGLNVVLLDTSLLCHGMIGLVCPRGRMAALNWGVAVCDRPEQVGLDASGGDIWGHEKRWGAFVEI
ncbi:MAG: hypothetical protein AAFR57_11700, partial [Pseudomonadota bacterium]